MLPIPQIKCFGHLETTLTTGVPFNRISRLSLIVVSSIEPGDLLGSLLHERTNTIKKRQFNIVF